MNTIYSKVWNKSLGILVVASEHARAHGKGGASRRLRAAMAALPLAAGAALALASPATYAHNSQGSNAQAGTICSGFSSLLAPVAKGYQAFACGAQAKANGDNLSLIHI